MVRPKGQHDMNEQARRIWKTPEGVGLFRKMLAGGPLDVQDRQTLAELKRADPPKQHSVSGNKMRRPTT